MIVAEYHINDVTGINGGETIPTKNPANIKDWAMIPATLILVVFL